MKILDPPLKYIYIVAVYWLRFLETFLVIYEYLDPIYTVLTESNKAYEFIIQVVPLILLIHKCFENSTSMSMLICYDSQLH